MLGVGVETIIGFDENVAFNNFNSKIEQQIGRYDMPIEMKKLYEENIQLLKEKILYLEAEIALLKKNNYDFFLIAIHDSLNHLIQRKHKIGATNTTSLLNFHADSKST